MYQFSHKTSSLEISPESTRHTGLTADDHPYTTIDREGFWTGLNNCWLYALSHAGAARTEDQRLTDRHFYQLRESAIAWADRLERYGLVDYEMGWWEADVLEAIDTNLAVGMGGLGTHGKSIAGERVQSHQREAREGGREGGNGRMGEGCGSEGSEGEEVLLKVEEAM